MVKNLKISLFLLFGLLVCLAGYPDSHADFKKAPSGLRYKIFRIGKDTVKPVIGDWVSLEMRYTTIVQGKDTLLFDSKTQLKGTPVRFQLPPSDFKGDLYEGISMLSPSDSAIFLIPADSLFLKTFRMPKRPEVIADNSTVSFYVHLLTVENPEKMMKDEVVILQKYIFDNKITVAPTESGVYIIPSQMGDGIKIDTGCLVKLHMKVATIDGKQIFSSFERPEPLKFQFGTRFDIPGIVEAINTMKKGEKARVIIPSKMAFGEKGRSTIVPPYTTLVYDVEIMDVLSKAESEKILAAEKQAEAEKKGAVMKDETVLIEKYLSDNKITTKPNPSGLYYIETAKGTGTQAVAGKRVSVHYTGTLLNGQKFDSSRDRNQPFEFNLGGNEVIKGWDEGIALMKQGGKAILIIPSKLGYGDREMGSIPAYSTLVFDVELIEVK
jgi:FKBP-type peptidyl-prolyl cis-trans isomerase